MRLQTGQDVRYGGGSNSSVQQRQRTREKEDLAFPKGPSYSEALEVLMLSLLLVGLVLLLDSQGSNCENHPMVRKDTARYTSLIPE
jgi:hypothetical protein